METFSQKKGKRNFSFNFFLPRMRELRSKRFSSGISLKFYAFVLLNSIKKEKLKLLF